VKCANLGVIYSPQGNALVATVTPLEVSWSSVFTALESVNVRMEWAGLNVTNVFQGFINSANQAAGMYVCPFFYNFLL